jgi:hypothetical protein
MSFINHLSFQQLLAFFFINLVGLFLIFLVFRLMPKKQTTSNMKLMISGLIGLIGLGLLTVGLLDAGIYLWKDSSNLSAVVSLLPLLICLSPIIFPIIMIGGYIQLIYRDKIQNIVHSESIKIQDKSK